MTSFFDDILREHDLLPDRYRFEKIDVPYGALDSYKVTKKTPQSSQKSKFIKFESILFDISLSFSGNNRSFVEGVSDYLKKNLPNSFIFYDNDYRAYLAKSDLDLTLSKIYLDRSRLIVVFIDSSYKDKEWCLLEWSLMRDIIKRCKGEKIMFIRFDNTEIPGILSTYGYIPIDSQPPDDIGELILQRAFSDGVIDEPIQTDL